MDWAFSLAAMVMVVCRRDGDVVFWFGGGRVEMNRSSSLGFLFFVWPLIGAITAGWRGYGRSMTGSRDRGRENERNLSWRVSGCTRLVLARRKRQQKMEGWKWRELAEGGKGDALCGGCEDS